MCVHRYTGFQSIQDLGASICNQDYSVLGSSMSVAFHEPLKKGQNAKPNNMLHDAVCASKDHLRGAGYYPRAFLGGRRGRAC